MLALLELDVTEARAAIRTLQAQGTRVSLFAFIVHAVATALAEHPELHTLRYGRRLVRFEDVDINVPVEVDTTSGAFPRPVVVRHADRNRFVRRLQALVEGAASLRLPGTGGVRAPAAPAAPAAAAV